MALDVYSRGVFNDSLKSIHQILRRHFFEVHDNSSSFGLHMSHVIRLIKKQRDADHRDTVIYSFIYAVCASVCDERFGFWMTWTKKQSAIQIIQYFYLFFKRRMITSRTNPTDRSEGSSHRFWCLCQECLASLPCISIRPSIMFKSDQTDHLCTSLDFFLRVTY